MKLIKNIGTKIVNVGTRILMPDDTMTCEPEVADVPSIRALCGLGFLKVGDVPEEVSEVVDEEVKDEEPVEPAPKKKSARKAKTE